MSGSSATDDGGIVRRQTHLWLTAAGAFICVACLAAPVGAATATAKVSANVLKPLTVTWLQDLDLGTIALGGGTFSSVSVGISRTGAFTCPASLVCTGARQVAMYNVTGSNS